MTIEDIEAEVWWRARLSRLKGWLQSYEVRWTLIALIVAFVWMSQCAFADDGVSSPWTAVILGVVLGLLLAGTILVIGNLILSDLTPKDEGKVLPPKGRWS